MKKDSINIACFSDTHGQHNKLNIPHCDILIFAGDAIVRYDHEIFAFLAWLDKQPAKHKIIVAGNHDCICQNQEKLIKDTCKSYNNIHYLCNTSKEIMGFKIYGTPIQPEFNNWAFNCPSDIRETYYNLIPVDTNILITHCPPKGILDENEVGDSCGCEKLKKRLNFLPDLRYHIFGHIHHSNDIKKVGNTTFVNCSVLNDKYELVNDVRVIEVVK